MDRRMDRLRVGLCVGISGSESIKSIGIVLIMSCVLLGTASIDAGVQVLDMTVANSDHTAT